MSEVACQTVEILKNFGSRERFIGVVDHYDQAGTTAFIRSGDQFYLAFASEAPGLKPGQLVSFSISFEHGTLNKREKRMLAWICSSRDVD